MKKLLLLASLLIAGCTTNPFGPEPTITKTEIIMSVQFDGKWSGYMAIGDNSSSVDGTGDKSFTYTKTDDWYYISAQKDTADDKLLGVSIVRRVTLSDGKVNTVIEKSADTSAEYGVATASIMY